MNVTQDTGAVQMKTAASDDCKDVQTKSTDSEKAAHQETDPDAATQCTFSYMKPNVTGETWICEHNIGIGRNESEREVEENDVKSATS